MTLPLTATGTGLPLAGESVVGSAEAVTVGAVLSVTVMLKVWAALVFWPPFAVPPLSRSRTVTVAVPTLPELGV